MPTSPSTPPICTAPRPISCVTARATARPLPRHGPATRAVSGIAGGAAPASSDARRFTSRALTTRPFMPIPTIGLPPWRKEAHDVPDHQRIPLLRLAAIARPATRASMRPAARPYDIGVVELTAADLNPH